MVDLIIARYNENIDWVSKLDFQFNKIFVYNKGKKLNLPFVYDIPNVGRESDSYLTYIIDNYERIPDIVVFLQGNPFDHTPELFNIIKNLPNIELINTLCNLHFKRNFLYKEIVPLGNIWSGKFNKINPWLKYNSYPAINQVFNIFYGFAGTPKDYFANWGAQYIVKKEVIYKYNLQQYKDVKKLFETNYRLPWFMELYWMYFFLKTKDDLLVDNFLKIY